MKFLFLFLLFCNFALGSGGGVINPAVENGSPTFQTVTLTSTTDPFRVNLLTTTQKNALTPGNGDILYDTTLNLFQFRQNGAWASLGSGSSSPLTTKGDLYGYSTVDARIPVGTNGQVLTADSTQALGVKWATNTPGSGASTALDNLASVAINTALLPGVDGTINLGSSSKRFFNAWMTGNLISGGTTIQRAGSIGPVFSVQASGDGYVGFEALNSGVGVSSFESITVGESIAGNKFGGIEYANNSFFEGTIYTNNQLSLGAKSGAVGGILINTDAAAPIIFGTTSTERMRITDSLITSSPPTIMGTGGAITGRLEQLLLYKSNTSNGGPLSVINPNSGAAAFSEINLGFDVPTGKFGSFWYLGDGYSDSGIFKKNQFAMASRPGATNGLLFDTFGVEAPIVFATNDVERLNITSAGLTMPFGELLKIGTGTTPYSFGWFVGGSSTGEIASMIQNSGAGAGSFSRIVLSENYAGELFGGLSYVNASYAGGGNVNPSSVELESRINATGGVQIAALAPTAPIRFVINSIEVLKSTADHLTTSNDVTITNATGVPFSIAANANSFQVSRLTNNNGGSGAGTRYQIGESIAGNQFLDMIYLNSGFTPSGLYLASQASFTAFASATGGLLFNTLSTAPHVFGVNNTEKLRINTDVTATGANLIVATAGKGLQIKSGTNGMAGTAVLVAGTVAVSNTAVTANTVCLATVQSLSGIAAAVGIECKPTAATGIVITSASVLDTSTIGYMLIEAN